MKFNLPNIFTIARAALAPLFLVLFLQNADSAVLAAAVVFIVAAITDYLDGWLARRYGETSDWGRVNDPLADKILTTAAFLAFAAKGYAAWWMVGVVVVRDVATTYLRHYADVIHKPMHTSFSAKSKTFAQLAFIITVLVLEAALSLPFLHALPQGFLVAVRFCLQPWLVNMIMLALTLFTAWTGIEYFLTNHHVACRLWLRILRWWRRAIGSTAFTRTSKTARATENNTERNTETLLR
jgi:CDP-diacylglycerol---glycerol-3-phosphate 3-phosphatidyltransferase